MEIEGEEYVFTYSCFEYQNKVIEGRNPSNMDVVVVGIHKNTQMPVVFFIESKFSEYYERPRKQLEVAFYHIHSFKTVAALRKNKLRNFILKWGRTNKSNTKQKRDWI